MLAVPVLLRYSVQVSGVPAQFDPAEDDTTAVLVKVPNRPKKNPETAVAAMSVIAISITEARTGEIAFLDSGERINIAGTNLLTLAISHCGVGIRTEHLPSIRNDRDLSRPWAKKVVSDGCR